METIALVLVPKVSMQDYRILEAEALRNILVYDTCCYLPGKGSSLNKPLFGTLLQHYKSLKMSSACAGILNKEVTEMDETTTIGH